jgi:4-amino-4-deoxy-L-arabinose transferase-like glycosyltransferase
VTPSRPASLAPSWLLKQPYYLAAAILLALVAAVYYLPFLHELPTAIHAWAQSDRLALAINFYDYGFHFLTPRTSALTSIGGVTGVELPLQAYLAALSGLIFGRSNISAAFRLLDVAMTVVGFFYLFRLVYERTGHFAAGLVPAAFLLASPVFAFYAGSTLPDPFGLSLSFVGYYYWLRYFDTSQQFADLLKAFAVLTLATLIKTTIGLHLSAVASITLLYALLQPSRFTPRQRVQLLLALAAGVAVVVGFYLHNQHLNTTYRSLQFLAATMPADTPEAQHEYLQRLRTIWFYEYLTRTHYRVLLGSVLVCLALSRRAWRQYAPLLLLLGSALLIVPLFYRLMGAQLAVHDYYIICSFLPPALLLLLLALLLLAQYTGKVRYVTTVGFGLLAIYLLSTGYKRLNRRMGDDYPPFSQYYNHLWMRGGAAEMQRAGVPAAAQALFVAGAVNVAQVYFDRRGLSWEPADVSAVPVEEFLTRMAADSLDYLVLTPTDYGRLAPQQAALDAAFETVGQNPAVILRRRNRQHPW